MVVAQCVCAAPELLVESGEVVVRVGEGRIELDRALVVRKRRCRTLHVLERHGDVEVDQGIVGIAPFAKILPLKGLSDDGFGSSADLAAAVHYAAAMGADITSNSWGGLVVDPVLEAAFDDAEASGVLSFAAAGNSARPVALMPALFQSVVSVAAVDDVEVLAPAALRAEVAERAGRAARRARTGVA